MERISVTLPTDLLTRIDDRVEEEYASRSEAIRMLVEQGLEYEDVHTENERLRRELQAANRRVDEHQELVRYVETERSIQERREQRERRRAEAGVLKRAKWWLVGMRDAAEDGRTDE